MHDKPNPDGLRWDYTAHDVKELSKTIITKTNNTLNQIINTPGPRTFDSFLRPFTNLESDLEWDSQPLAFLSSVAVSKEMREASKDLDKEISDFNTDMWMREDLYDAFVDFKNQALKDGSYAQFDRETRRYINQTMYDFKRNGMGLPSNQRNKLI